MFEIIIAILFMLFFSIILSVGRFREKRAWNNGRCKFCDAPLKSFDTSSQGDRGYCCSSSIDHGAIWISYRVDKHMACKKTKMDDILIGY